MDGDAVSNIHIQRGEKGGQGDAGAVGQGGGVLNLDGMRLSINYFPNIYHLMHFSCLMLRKIR